MKAWYVAHTHPHGEHKALGHLSRQGFEAYLPRFRKQRRHARKVEEVMAPLFPRYLFVRFDPERERWRAILSTIGVQHLVTGGDQLTPLPDNIVDEIRAREDDGGCVRLGRSVRYRPGERLRVAAGAFCDQVGLFERMDDTDRVCLLLNMLGRWVRATVPANAVAAAP